jgi:hypothetical protein
LAPNIGQNQVAAPKTQPRNRVIGISGHLVIGKQNPNPESLIRKLGGADRARTGDPLLAKQVLSQLSYSPLENSN